MPKLRKSLQKRIVRYMQQERIDEVEVNQLLQHLYTGCQNEVSNASRIGSLKRYVTNNPALGYYSVGGQDYIYLKGVN